MLDLTLIAAAGLFFAVAIAYVKGCQRLALPRSSDRQASSR